MVFQSATYLLLDAAHPDMPLPEAAAKNAAHDSLYRGTEDEKLAHVAPYLFHFSANTPFAGWYLANGWGASWGVLLKSSWPMGELQKHFRKFLTVKTETGEELYFRFYDPRVLRMFLPTCDALQIRELFGNAIDFFIVESEAPGEALRFSQQNGVLRTELISINKDEALSDIAAPAKEKETAPAPAIESNDQPAPKVKAKWNTFD